jgi:hypothetical protein
MNGQHAQNTGTVAPACRNAGMFSCVFVLWNYPNETFGDILTALRQPLFLAGTMDSALQYKTRWRTVRSSDVRRRSVGPIGALQDENMPKSGRMWDISSEWVIKLMLPNSHARDSGRRYVLNYYYYCYYYYHYHHHHKLTFSTNCGGRVVCLQRLVRMSATPNEGCLTLHAPFCPINPHIPSTSPTYHFHLPYHLALYKKCSWKFCYFSKIIEWNPEVLRRPDVLGFIKVHYMPLSVRYDVCFLRFLLWCSEGPNFLLGHLRPPPPP